MSIGTVAEHLYCISSAARPSVSSVLRSTWHVPGLEDVHHIFIGLLFHVLPCVDGSGQSNQQRVLYGCDLCNFRKTLMSEERCCSSRLVEAFPTGWKSIHRAESILFFRR